MVVILVSNEKKLILQKRDNDPGINYPDMICTFGGAVEKKEKPIDAAIREMREELDLELNESDLVFFKKYLRSDKIRYVYMINNVNLAELKLQEGEAIISISLSDNIDKINMPLIFKKIIKDFISWHKNLFDLNNKHK